MAKVATLERKRATYLKETRDLYQALYRGGYALEAFKATILPKRPAEHEDWWKLRLSQFHYLSRAAQILDELAGTVFQGDLEVLPKKVDGAKERPTLPAFYMDFFRDPLGGNSKIKLVDLLYSGLLKAQVHSDHFFRVLFPNIELPANASRADQETLGALRARVQNLHADAVTDFEEDETGLVWVKTAHRIENRDPLLDDGDRKDTLRWEIIDRERIRVFELEVPHGEAPKPGEDAAQKSYDVHRWAGVKRVPIVRLRLGDDVWLMDRMASMVLAETRKRNGLHWLEEVCCYPQPVHLGEESFSELRETDPNQNRKRGATVFFEGGKEDKFEYLEPSGSSLDHIAKRLESMGHEIASVVHQAASAIGPDAAKQIQSAASKVRDSVAKRLIAECYADDSRKAAVEIAELVSIGRGDTDFRWEAIGLEQHDIADVAEATNEALVVQAVKVNSDTFDREYQKGFTRRVMPGKPAATYEMIDKEIDAAPIEREEEPPPDDEADGNE